MRYEKTEAREWARESLVGCCGCVLPTFSSDLASLNETAIRYDVAREKELGMSAILIVSEGGTTVDEFNQMIEICVDESGGDLVTFLQASQPTFRDMVEAMQYAEQAGVDLVLPSYPMTYHPLSYDELFEDTKQLLDSTGLGVLLFCIDQWNFARLHPAGFPVDFLERRQGERALGERAAWRHPANHPVHRRDHDDAPRFRRCHLQRSQGCHPLHFRPAIGRGLHEWSQLAAGVTQHAWARIPLAAQEELEVACGVLHGVGVRGDQADIELLLDEIGAEDLHRVFFHSRLGLAMMEEGEAGCQSWGLARSLGGETALYALGITPFDSLSRTDLNIPSRSRLRYGFWTKPANPLPAKRSVKSSWQ